MNRVFRIVFNVHLGLWQVVSECARKKGKGGGRGSRRRPSARATLGAIAAAAAMVVWQPVAAQSWQGGANGTGGAALPGGTAGGVGGLGGGGGAGSVDGTGGAGGGSEGGAGGQIGVAGSSAAQAQSSDPFGIFEGSQWYLGGSGGGGGSATSVASGKRGEVGDSGGSSTSGGENRNVTGGVTLGGSGGGGGAGVGLMQGGGGGAGGEWFLVLQMLNLITSNIAIGGEGGHAASFLSGQAGAGGAGTLTIYPDVTVLASGRITVGGAAGTGPDSSKAGAGGFGILRFYSAGTVAAEQGILVRANGRIEAQHSTGVSRLEADISGAGTFTQTGAGTTVLVGNDTRTGRTTVSAGTLQIGDGRTVGSLAGNVALTSTAAALAFNRADTLTHAGLISGAGQVRQIGSGVTTLSGANTYTGSTVISGGALAISQNANLGDAAGGVSLSNQGSLRLGPGTYVSLGNRAIALGAGGGILHADGNATLQLDGVISGSALTTSGTGSLILAGANTYTGGTTITAGTLNVGSGTTGTLGAGDVSIAAAGGLAFNRSNVMTVENDISGAGHVAQIGSGTTILKGANTYVGSTIISKGTLQVGDGGLNGALGTGSVINNAALRFDRAGTLTVSGAISGTGSVTQAGSGTTVLTGANAYTGGTTINNGTLAIGHMAALGTGDVALNNGAELLSTVSGTETFGRLVTSNGRVSAATGTTFNVQSFAVEGSLHIGSRGNAGTVSLSASGYGLVRLLNNVAIDHGTFRYGDSFVANSLTNYGGWLSVAEGATADLNGLDVGTSYLDGAGRIESQKAGSPASLTVGVSSSGASTPSTFAGVIADGAGVLSLVKEGANTLTLAGTNSYTGGTTVNAGTLALSGSGTLALTGGAVALRGSAAVFDIAGASGNRIIGELSGVVGSKVVLGANTLSFGETTNATFAGAINGAGGGIVKTGRGTATLTGANTYTGGTTINNGTLAIGHLGALGTGDVTLNNGAELLSTVSGMGTFGQLVTNNGRISAATGTTFIALGYRLGGPPAGGTLRIGSSGNAGTVSVVSDFSSPIFSPLQLAIDHGTFRFSPTSLTIGGGRLTVAEGATADLNGLVAHTTLLDGAGRIESQKVGPATLMVGVSNPDASTPSAFSGVIANGAGIVSLVKEGENTLTLTGTNTYTGDTTVNAGTLAVGSGGTGSVAGNVQVNTGATLGGSGRIGGNVAVASGGTLAPGNSPGTLTVDGNLTLAAGSTTRFELGQPGAIGGASNDLVRVGGNLALGGSLQASAASAGWYRLFNYGEKDGSGQLSGSFDAATSSVTMGGVAAASYQLSSTAAAAGTPGQVNLSVTGAGQMLQFWNGAHQTPTLALEGGDGTWANLGSNWLNEAATGGPDLTQPMGWANSVAVFGGSAGTVSVQGDVAFDTLQFSTDGYDVAAASGGGALVIAPAASSAAAPHGTINTDAGVNASISAAITNSGGASNGLITTGRGTLTLSGANTYSGGTTVNAGTLVAAGNQALGTGAVAVDNSAGNDATLQVARGVSLSNAITLNHGAVLDNRGTVNGLGASSTQGAVQGGSGVNHVYNQDGGVINGLSGAGVRLGAGGTVRNEGTGVADSTRIGGAVGVQVDGAAGRVTNTAGGTISGINAGIVLDAGGTVENKGAGSSISGGTLVGAAVVIANGAGTVNNSGGARISGTGFFSTGVSMAGGGSLTNGEGSTVSGTVFSVKADGQMTLRNAGTLTGLVQLADVENHVTLVSGGVIQGDLSIGSSADSTLTLDGTAATQAFSAAVTGATTFAGGLIKDGAGTWVLDGDLNGTHSTSVRQGRLQIGDGGTTGSLMGNVNIGSGASLTVNRSNAITLAGIISGSGGFAQQGTGTTTLTGVNTYTGGSTVATGRLLVNGAVAGDVQVDSGATLGGSGSIGGNVTVAGTLATGNSPGTLTVGGDLTLAAGSRSQFELNQPNAVGGANNDLVKVGGDLTLDGTLDAQVAAAGWYTLFTYGGELNGAFASENVSSKLSGFLIDSYQLDATQNGMIRLSVVGVGQGLQFWQGGSGSWGGGGTWGSVPGTADSSWGGSVGVLAGSGGTVTVTGMQAFDTLQFASDGYRLQGDNLALSPTSGSAATLNVDSGVTATIANHLVDGSGNALTKVGGGTVILTGSNSYSGGTTIANGTLQLGDGGTSGSIVGNVSNNGALVFHRSDDFGFAGVVSGIGSLQQGGSGTSTLTGNHSYSGGTTITAGTLQIGDGGTSGSIVGNISNNGVLAFNRSDDFGFAGVVSGTGSLQQRGSGTVILTGSNSYSGDTTIANGTLQLGSGGTTGSIVGNVSNNGTLIFNRSDDIGFSGAVSGTGSLQQRGSGSLYLTGVHNYSGGTFVQSGRLAVNGSISGDLQVAQAGTLGGSGSIGGNVTVAGTLAPGNSPGTLSIGGNLTLLSSSTTQFELSQPGVVGGAQNDLVKVDGNLTLGGELKASISSAGWYRLFNYGGSVSGQFDRATVISTQPGSFSVASHGVVNVAKAGQIGLSVLGTGQTLQFWNGNHGTGGSAIGGNGKWSGFDSNWTDASGIARDSWAGSVAVFAGEAGTVMVEGSMAFDTLQFASDGYRVQAASTGGELVIAPALGNGALINVDAGVKARIDSAIVDGVGNSLTKVGEGTLTLSGGNRYSGGTTVNEGTLIAASDMALGKGAVSVDNAAGKAATLQIGNSLTLANAITVNNGGTLDNAGSIVRNSAGDIAVDSTTGGAIVNNLGAGSVIQGATAGVRLQQGGRISNAAGATIQGAEAIRALSGSTTLSNAGQLIGNVQLHDASANQVTLFSGSHIQGNLAIGSHAGSTLTLDGSGTQLYSQAVSGATTFAGSMSKLGSGSWTLDRAATHAGTTNVAAGILKAGAANVFSAASNHTVAAGASLELAGFSQKVGGISNSGTVSLLGGTPGTVLTVTGAWVGNNGLLAMGTQLGSDNSATDKLLLSGSNAVASGSTRIAITNLGGLGARTTGNGIQIVGTDNGGSIEAGAFSLSGPVVAGAYEYKLNTTSSGAYLSNTLTPDPEVIVPLYRSEASLYGALPAQLREAGAIMLGSVSLRTGDASSTAEQDHRQAWARAISADRTIDQSSVTGASSRGRLNGLQVGSDLWADANTHIGAYLGQLSGDMSVRGLVRGNANQSAGYNQQKSRYLGAYAGWSSVAGLYVEGVVQAGRNRTVANPDQGIALHSNGNSLMASIEVGQSFALSSQWRLQPQLQLLHQQLDLDDARVVGAEIQQRSADSWQARAGARITGEFATGRGTLQPYARVNYSKRGGGSDVARFITPTAVTDIASRVAGSTLEVAAGLSWQLRPAARVYGEVGTLAAPSGASQVNSGANGSVGVALGW